MAKTVRLDNLRDLCRQTSDTENDPHITDAEVTGRVNWYVQRLWNRLYMADPDRCTVTSTIATTAGTLAYNLPADFVEIRTVDLVQGTDLVQVQRYEQGNRWRHRYNAGYLPPLGDTSIVYRIMGQERDGSEAQIHFLPDPGTATYQIRYVQTAPLMSLDADTVDGIAGFEQWIAYRVARDLMKKQKRYEGDFEAEIAELNSEIDALAHNRDAAEAPQVADVRSARRHHLTAR